MGPEGPHAVLFGDGEDETTEKQPIVGIHFAGPTWESNDGSKVAGTALASVRVDHDAIPWLLLKVASSSGAFFANATYVQRLATVGGVAPTLPGTTAGEEVSVPYIAEYYFYRAVPPPADP
ncbi:MAG: DUF3455 domain-containing protein [Verrucomicrobia bacterium]|nr:DUF3455 domain-containing protein [Verrucomicrobiota bacterium]